MIKGKLIKSIPNILTMVNMLLGIVSILILIWVDHPQKIFIVTGLILLGAIADFFDGFAARKLDASTKLGKHLDSYADIITFGIAPICLIKHFTFYGNTIIVVSSLIFIATGAYRLVRHNLEDSNDYFIGLPITVAGIVLAMYSTIYSYWNFYYQPGGTIATALLLLFLSAMMVSKKKFNRILFSHK
ncbi:MAG: CDP-alcohol phosphatidyltransferase family protein [Defluviitaleaceae bacterium]|nr:CDP-alcohol phosphatidyltransferase family protein [Defluviitaleaceae bacterium]